MSRENRATYYMPLSASSLRNGLTGPSTCAFSSPAVPYTKETQDLVKLLMKESKLTHSQRNGFQVLLRSGNDKPQTFADSVERRREFLLRRADRGRAIGLNIDPRQDIQNLMVKQRSHQQYPAGRRSYESIKASGALETPSYTRAYVPTDKEVEKDRFSYKMTYGRNPKPKAEKTETPHEPPSILNEYEHRYEELIEEMKDRADFLESMGRLKKDKSYRPYIISQIHEKLNELKTLFPSRVDQVIESIGLARIDPSFSN